MLLLGCGSSGMAPPGDAVISPTRWWRWTTISPGWWNRCAVPAMDIFRGECGGCGMLKPGPGRTPGPGGDLHRAPCAGQRACPGGGEGRGGAGAGLQGQRMRTGSGPGGGRGPLRRCRLPRGSWGGSTGGGGGPRTSWEDGRWRRCCRGCCCPPGVTDSTGRPIFGSDRCLPPSPRSPRIRQP